MGLGGQFTMLLKGLVLGGIAKIHFNGLLSKVIILKCGVFQGFPLAPLLLALTIQPLLAYLQHEHSKGRMS